MTSPGLLPQGASTQWRTLDYIPAGRVQKGGLDWNRHSSSLATIRQTDMKLVSHTDMLQIWKSNQLNKTMIFGFGYENVANR